MQTRLVALLAYDGAQVLDLTGPAEVFWVADQLLGGGAYRVVIASADGRDTTSASGLRMGVQAALADVGGPVDTFVVPGTPDWERLMADPALLSTIRAGSSGCRRVAAVCAGAFLLGAVGLLEGRRATTHWMFLDDLEKRFPGTTVERDPIFVTDGTVFTSAGVTAGIDLALAMVEADHGADLTRRVAQFLVVFMQRPGGQAQFSVRLRAGSATGSPLRELLDSIAADPAGDHRLTTLAERAGFSSRHLARLFLRDLHMTPGRWVEQVRVEAARMLLESTDAPVEAVARRSGLGSPETLRRCFVREVGITPHAYRRRFRTTGVGAAQSPATAAAAPGASTRA